VSAYGTTTPRRPPLSHHDWICAGCSPDLEVLALNERGSILVGRIADWDDRLHSVFPQLPPLAGHPELRMSHRAAAAKVDEDLSVELSKFTGHILNCALAGCTSVGYAYCLTPSDDAVMRAGALLEFIEDGRDFAPARSTSFSPPPHHPRMRTASVLPARKASSSRRIGRLLQTTRPRRAPLCASDHRLLPAFR
jgi:hypothetical protein